MKFLSKIFRKTDTHISSNEIFAVNDIEKENLTIQVQEKQKAFIFNGYKQIDFHSGNHHYDNKEFMHILFIRQFTFEHGFKHELANRKAYDIAVSLTLINEAKLANFFIENFRSNPIIILYPRTIIDLIKMIFSPMLEQIPDNAYSDNIEQVREYLKKNSINKFEILGIIVNDVLVIEDKHFPIEKLELNSELNNEETTHEEIVIQHAAKVLPTKKEYYYLDKGKRIGPLSISELNNLFLSNDINGETLVWRLGLQWTSLKSLNLF